MSGLRTSKYLLSVPERVLRSATALTAGLVRELGDVTIPSLVRRSRVYQALVDSTLRFLIEQVGQVEGTYASGDKLAEDFLLRRTAGNGLEIVGVLAFRASPVWVMAALADVSGAGKALLQEIAGELKREGMLAPDAEFENIEQILDGLERTSARLAEACNTPPLDVPALRQEWADIQREFKSIPAPNLPAASDVWTTWNELKTEAAAQQRSVFEVSSLLALDAVARIPENLLWLGKSAALATRKTGEVFAKSLLDHYSGALREIRRTGFVGFSVRQYRPYLRAAVLQFSPKRRSLTQRLLSKSFGLLVCSVVLAEASVAQTAKPAKAANRAVRRVSPAPAKRPSSAAILPSLPSAQALRAHVEFLASDTLQGRKTPSPGLDVAAEYIAAQFRRVGLQPGNVGSYFVEAPPTIEIVDKDVPLTVNLANVSGPLPAMSRSPFVKFVEFEELSRNQTQNRVIFTTPEGASFINDNRAVLAPRAIFAISSDRWAEEPGITYIWDEKLIRMFEFWPEGTTNARVTVRPAGLKNVIGLLPGNDPQLRDQCVLVSAHYDHIGTRDTGDDRIFNGANDNASGVAGMIEAGALLRDSKLRRTVVFAAFFGEEPGLLGSEFYGRAPACPIEKTAAQINLEQLGRTDDTKGARVGAVTITGNDFSELGGWLATAAAEVGGKVDPFNADAYFGRSDNVVLARAGVPAHTISVALQFPDYHGADDEADRLDYDNMALVTRMVAAGAMRVANDSDTPRWRLENSKAEIYRRRATLLSTPRAASVPTTGNSPASPKPRRPAPSGSH